MYVQLKKVLLCLCLGVFFSACAQSNLKPDGRRSLAAVGDGGADEARDHFTSTLMALQGRDGQWSGSFISDATMEAIPLVFLSATGLHDTVVEEQALARIFALQDPSTHLWLKFPHGAPSIETTGVVLYALKKRGIEETDHRVKEAWQWFYRHHGFKAMNLSAQLIAIATEQVATSEIPLIEKLTTEFFSRSGAFSLVGVGSWRDMLVPFLVWNFYHGASAQHRPVSKLSPARVASAGNLLGRKSHAGEFDSKKEFWAQEGLGWLLNRQQADGSWCGYIPCTLYSAMALSAATRAGVGDFSSRINQAWQAMVQRRFTLSSGGVAQAPSTKSIWDTARTLTALRTLPAKQREALSPKVDASVGWLLAQEITTPGNWSIEMPAVKAAGWSFQTHNLFNPDTDDTIQVVRALMEWKDSLPARSDQISKVSADSVSWLLHFQQRNGGFAAFSKMNYRLLKAELFLYRVLSREHLPNLFLNADNDVTARVIIGLAEYLQNEPTSPLTAPVKRSIGAACGFLKRSKKTPDWATGGVWNATWMVNYLHGTAQAVEALLDGGCVSTTEVAPQIAWLMKVQDGGGGWGESPASYDVHRYVAGPPNVVQTSFTLQALIAYEKSRFTNEKATDPEVDRAIQRGLDFLLTQTRGANSPLPESVTEVFIPKIWYVSYELQPHYELVRVLGASTELRNLRKNSGF